MMNYTMIMDCAKLLVTFHSLAAESKLQVVYRKNWLLLYNMDETMGLGCDEIAVSGAFGVKHSSAK